MIYQSMNFFFFFGRNIFPYMFELETNIVVCKYIHKQINNILHNYLKGTIESGGQFATTRGPSYNNVQLYNSSEQQYRICHRSKIIHSTPANLLLEQI